MDEFIAGLVVFKNDGEGDSTVDQNVMAQVTAAYPDGTAEVAVTLPTHKLRVYLRLPVVELVRMWGLAKKDATP